MAPYDLDGKVALITGGAGGIGFGLAQALVKRGARVALVDLNASEVAEAAGRLGRERAVGLVADVTDPAAIRQAVDAAVERFGGIDVLVANAGIAPAQAPVRVMPPQEWEKVVEVNLLGVYRTVSAGLEQVIARHGHVVVVSSVYAFMNGVMMTPYAVSKAGVEQLGLALRVELAPHGAGATVAYFGYVDTAMVRGALERRRQLTGDEPGAVLRKAMSPDQAGEAIAAAIERRQARVIAPRRWAILSALRGVLSPALGSLATRSGRVHRSVETAEAAAERRS